MEKQNYHDDKPWFKLNPNNYSNKWWRYSTIVDSSMDETDKSESDIIAQLIIQDTDITGTVFWRCSIWYKNDPNRYLHFVHLKEWTFDKPLRNMNEGDIVTQNNNKYKVYNCAFSEPEQIQFCKILERIQE